MTFEPVTRQVRAAVGRYGTRVALHEVRDGVTHLTTYSQLGRRATQHVAALRDVFADLDTAAGASRAAGARGPQDSRYVVVAGDGPDALIAELAVLAIGAISVPVATLDGATLAELRAEGIDPSAGFAAAPAGDVDIVCLPIAPTIWFADTPGRPELPPDAPAILLREGGRHTILTHGQLAAGVESLRELLPLEPGQRQAVYLPDSPAAARGFAWHALTQGAQICHVSDAAQIPALRARVVAVDVDHVPSPPTSTGPVTRMPTARAPQGAGRSPRRRSIWAAAPRPSGPTCPPRPIARACARGSPGRSTSAGRPGASAGASSGIGRAARSSPGSCGRRTACSRRRSWPRIAAPSATPRSSSRAAITRCPTR